MVMYIIYTTTYVCKKRVVALLLMELLSKMRKMRTITPLDATCSVKIKMLVSRKNFVTYVKNVVEYVRAH